MIKVFKIIKTWQIAVILSLLVILVVTGQVIWLTEMNYDNIMVSFYHNYLIFKHSFFHLLENANLYQSFPGELDDLYKYSPTFALFFGLFAYLNDYLGLFLWNGLNALAIYAIWQLKFPEVKNKLWVWAFIIVEFITSIQNSQSNGLMVGLIILGFLFLERKNILLATLFIVLSVYIKLFGLVAFALFLMYPDKWKAIGYSVMWFVVLFALPLIVVSPVELIQQYQNWFDLLMVDKALPYSPSVVGWLKSWFNFIPSGIWVIGVGVLLFMSPYLRSVQYKNRVFRQFMLASVLIWVVIFNHKAESPTFIIAIAGAAIWFFSQKRTIMNFVLILLALIFTQLSPSDLFPRFVREIYFIPFVVKVVPMILIWLKLLFDSFGLESNGIEMKELNPR